MGQWAKPFMILVAAGLYACQGADNQGPEIPATQAGPAQSAPPSAIVDPGEIKTAAEYLAEERFAAADQTLGRRVFLQCRACHALDAKGGHRVGPNLYDLFGHPAAVKEGFNYSPALSEAGIVWTPKALEEWLIRPSSFVPGNKMAFAGIRRETDRTALLAYLLKETSAPAE